MLQARSLSFHVGSLQILESVDVEAPSGTVTAIVGPNGAGKSTLLRILAGFERPASGEVTIDGKPAATLTLGERARLRGYMSPTIPEFIDFPVREVVRMGRHPWDTTRAQSDEAVERALAAMRLEDLASQIHSTLSTGEARRVHVARLLAQEVPLMLLDEPASGLDIGYSEMVLDRLRTRADDGSTVVTVLHDLNAAGQYADQIALMDRGRVVATGTPAQVFTNDQLSTVYRHPITVIDHPFRSGPLILADQLDGS